VTNALSKISCFDYKRYINYCFVGLAFSIPISKALTSIFTGTMILLWLLEGNFKEKFKIIRHNSLSVAILFIVTLSVVSILWSSNIHFAVKFIVGKYWYFIPIIIMLTSFELKYVRYILDGFLLSMFISEIASYGVYFDLWHINNATRTNPAVFMDHTDYSIYLAFAIMVILIKMYEQINIRSRILLAIFFITATSNLFINGGRTGQFAFIAAMALLALIYFRKSYKVFASLIITVIVVISLAYKFSPNFHSRMDLLHTDLTNAYVDHNFTGSFAGRVALWSTGADIFIEHPLHMYGIGDYMNDFSRYIKKLHFNDAHFKTYTDYSNNFIDYSVQFGIVGLIWILYINYLLFVFKIKEKRYKMLSIAFAIVYICHEMGGASFYLMNSNTLFAVFAGLFNSIAQREKDGLLIA